MAIKLTQPTATIQPKPPSMGGIIVGTFSGAPGPLTLSFAGRSVAWLYNHLGGSSRDEAIPLQNAVKATK